MKNNNLLKAVLGLLICLFGLYIYTYPPTKECCNDEKETVDLPAISMPKTLVQNMINNYRINQLKAIGNNPEYGMKDDAQSTWFDIADLKTFIKTIENKAPKGSKDLGIRFYYAAYPSDTLFGKEGYESLADFNNDKIKKQYGKRHTLILIPTINENGVNKDFNPAPSTKSNVQARMITIDVMAKNHTQLSPPHTADGQEY
jgi:hypothetical protein